MRKYYSGKFKPKNISKYIGDHSKIAYRSLWERQVMRWLDSNSSVLKWSSEETVIPYICATDGKVHRYFMDFKVVFKTGASSKTYLIEVKPKKQTEEPKKQSKKTKSYINEVMTYAKNQSKWEQAEKYCKDRGWIFEIWTEHTLKALGIKLMTGQKPLKRMKKPKKKL